MSVGFAVETVAYRAFGGSQDLPGTHLYDNPTQYGLIFSEFFLVHTVWAVAEAVLGAAFYRSVGLGMLLIPVGLGMAILAEITVEPSSSVPGRG